MVDAGGLYPEVRCFDSLASSSGGVLIYVLLVSVTPSAAVLLVSVTPSAAYTYVKGVGTTRARGAQAP